MKENKVIAFFDFDGTITNRDIFWDYLFFRLKHGLSVLKLLKCIPYFTLYLTRILNNEQAKQTIFSTLFKGETKAFFNSTISKYYAINLYKRVKVEALDRIYWHKRSIHTVCIVSANFDLIVNEFARQHNLELICTILDVKNGILTGRFETANCYGIEKVKRIKEQFSDLDSYSQIYAYGDSKGDTDMLALATDPYYCVFKK